MLAAACPVFLSRLNSVIFSSIDKTCMLLAMRRSAELKNYNSGVVEEFLQLPFKKIFAHFSNFLSGRATHPTCGVLVLLDCSGLPQN